jgi:beta-lactamase regulating signal transducer with metallopeptidase domain
MQSLWEIVASNAVVVVVLAAGVALLGRLWRNPLCLHLLWLLVLLKLATPPILTVPLPSMPRQAAMPSAEIAATEHLEGPASGEAIEREAFAAAVDRDEPSLATDQPVLEKNAASETPVASPVVEEAREIPWAAVLSWTWGTGIVVFGFACVWRTWRFGRLLRTSQAASPQVLNMAAVLAKRLGLRRLPEIRMLSVCVSPLVWSFGGSARVYLPAALFERLDGPAREAIIAHELAHVRRKDHWVRLLEMVVTTLFWWHPVVWWAVRRLRELEDQCCDAMVVDLSPQGVRSYATALLDTLDFLCERSMAAPLGATAATSSESMKRRIAMLKNRSWAVRMGMGHVALLLGISALPMALAFGERPADTSEEAPPLQASSASQEQAPTADNAPQVDVRLFVVAVPRKLDLVRQLPNGGVILSETKVKKLLEDHKAGVRAAPRLVCALGNDAAVNYGIDFGTLLACQVVPESIKDTGAIVLRIRPIAAIKRPGSTEAMAELSRPKEWPTSINAELKPGETVALGGWDDPRSEPGGKDSVTVLLVQANRSSEPAGKNAPKAAVQRRSINELKPGETVALGRWDNTRREPGGKDSVTALLVGFDRGSEPAGRNAPKPAVQRRTINKPVKDFPEKADLSTPESAAAAFNRVLSDPDPAKWLEMSAWKYTPRDVEAIRQRKEPNKDEVARAKDPYRNAEIVEVLAYRDGLAEVISKVVSPKATFCSSRLFGRFDGQWKNLGENAFPSVEEARKRFDQIKDDQWDRYVKMLEGIKNGKPVMLGGDRPKRAASIAPGQPMGISVEKADLMGRIEWTFMHGSRDVTARKSLEWGEIEKDKDGNRTLRYKFEATIWGKEVLIANQVFTFDAKGNILEVTDVDGYPKKKVEKPKDVNTQKGMKDLVEDFFSKNFRDVTSRKTIEWGEVEKTADGNSSIRHKYRARIWYKETKIMNQVFTFNPKGEFVSVKDVEGFPQPQADEPVKPEDVNSQEGMKKLVEDFFDHNFRDVKSRETIEWGEVTKTGDGNSSIRYKYRARIWDKETKIINQVFTFDRNGKFVSVKDLKEAAKKKGEGADDEAAAGKIDPPAAVVAKFLDAVKLGNNETASRMLSSLARKKMGKMLHSTTPPASDTAKFTVGKVELVGNDGARVAATWTDLEADRTEKTDKTVWVLRREPDGWRICGVVSQVFSDAPPLVLNFEDPQDMLRKQQWVREEYHRREPAGAK